MKKKFIYIFTYLLVTANLSSGVSSALSNDFLRVSVTSSGTQMIAGDALNLTMSSDANYVVFNSNASNLVPNDTNNTRDLFVRDIANGTTTRVNISTSGLQEVNNQNGAGSISNDGRYIVFSTAAAFDSTDNNGLSDIYLRDNIANTTSLISTNAQNIVSNSGAAAPDISGDGRYVVFISSSTNMINGISGSHIYRKDLQTGEVILVDKIDSNSAHAFAQISCDGSKVSFASNASNLVPNDTNNFRDIFISDLNNATLTNITLNADNLSNIPVISCDGNSVVYSSLATNLDDFGNNNTGKDAFVYNSLSGTTKLVSTGNYGSETDAIQERNFSISSDGRFVTFTTYARLAQNNMDGNSAEDVYVRDMYTGSVKLVSYRRDGTAGGGLVGSVSGDGKYIAFNSGSSAIISDSLDTNGAFDVFRNINPRDLVNPVVVGTPTGEANDFGWYGTDVIINWLATDPLPSSGSPTQPAPILASTEGTNTYESGQSCDPAGNCATGNITISIDKSVPIITGALDRIANAQNWFNTDVTATFTCSDAISGVASCTAPVLINSEGQGQSVRGTATDQADNAASMTIADINIDKTLPSIGYSLGAPANASGWHNQDVEVSFSCSDGLSGLLLCSLPTTVTTEGQGQTVTGTAFDNADNTQSVTASLNIDKTIPLITYGLSEAANQYGWHNQDVTVNFICIDGLSGIMACPEPVTLVSEGASQSVSGSAQDLANNSASVTTAGINIDKTAPNITANVSTPPNSGGWNSGAVTITFTCSDELSGIDTCSSPVTISEEGQNQVVTGTAVDKAGNVSTTTATVSIDATKPTIVATQTPPANNNGWNNSNVTVSFVCSDALSGIAACSGPVTITTDGQNQSVSGTAMDNAGNSNTVTANINIDRVAPVTGDISASTTFLLAAGNVTINTSVSDALSGISKVEYYVDSDPGLGNGMPMSISGSTASATVAVPSGPLANHTINVRTRDNAGNWSPIKSVTIFVLL